MEQFRYPINHDESITRWRLTDPGDAPVESPMESFDAPINTHEAYVQIVYPVRKFFLKTHDLSKIPLPAGPFNNIHFPFEQNRIDFTTFIKTPHHIWVEGVSWFDAPVDGTYPFDLFTCGGIKIWVNGTAVCSFAPFTRNIPGKTRIDIPFKKGINEIKVYADELAERDVFFYFELRYKGSIQTEGVLFLEKGAAGINKTEQFLLSCYFPKDCLTEGDILLHYDRELVQEDRELFLRGNIKGEFNAFKMPDTVTARKGTDHVAIGSVADSVGMYKVKIGADAGGQIIYRELLLGLKPELITNVKAAPGIEGRKIQALDFAVKYGEETITRALAICERQGVLGSDGEKCVRNSLAMIDAMEDCADFVLVPLCLLITRYRALVSEKLFGDIHRILLKFRYWIDEPGNDVMWYFSENHAFLFHCSQYLAGSIFPEDIFSAGGKTGKEQFIKGKERLNSWFDLFFKYGYAEWNSATYLPVDFIGLFILYEMAPDADIRNRAKEALDYTFKVMMYNSFNGIMSSSYGRAYEYTLKAREQVETCFLEWIAYGSGFINYRSRAASLFSLSSYKPPRYDEEIKTGEGDWMSVTFDQGVRQVKTYAYRTGDFFTACVRRFRPFTHGHQQHLMNISLGKTGVQFYINHPGERAYSGGNRPSYWAGNGTMPFIEQYRDLTAMIFNTDAEELVHYIHGYTTFYDYDEYETGDHWLFIRVDQAYCAVWFSNGYEVVKQGANTGKEVISRGLNHGVIVKCGNAYEWGSFAEFANTIKGTEISCDGERSLSFQDPRYGLLCIHAPNSATLNGKELEYTGNPEMEILRGKLCAINRPS